MQGLVQLALDLFGPPDGDRPAAPVSKEKQPPVLVEKEQVASKKIAKGITPEALTLQEPLAPASFRHPQACREVLLGDTVVAYALQRARRRSIGFTVGSQGLAVRAPTWVTLSAVDAALHEKSGWILRKLGEARERQQRMEQARIDWRHGAVLPYLGAPLQLVLDTAQPVAGVLRAATAQAQGGAVAQLHMGLPHSACAEQIRAAAQAWLMRQARQHFAVRLDHFAALLGVRWSSLRLSSARTRWGSARSDGSIRLNWRLLHYPPAVIDYVVAHELAHLRVMDHSPRFWATVASVVPDHAALRRHLHEQPAPRWD
jgi:predicted metal-dependent hydrolase